MSKSVPIFSLERKLSSLALIDCTAKIQMPLYPSCQPTESTDLREELRDKGRLRTLGVTSPYSDRDSSPYQLQVGYSGVNAPITTQYKRIPGPSLKNVLLGLWAMEAEIRDPRILDDLSGVQISECTSNTERVALSKLLYNTSMLSYLRNFDWEDDTGAYASKYATALKDRSDMAKKTITKISSCKRNMAKTY
ncbi:hypothetical protein NHQ30_007434 [Ciborinia camelliae]|nr:hypothetical protein NHQ30_007434 [Ciborinia camelliae]